MGKRNVKSWSHTVGVNVTKTPGEKKMSGVGGYVGRVSWVYTVAPSLMHPFSHLRPDKHGYRLHGLPLLAHWMLRGGLWLGGELGAEGGRGADEALVLSKSWDAMQYKCQASSLILHVVGALYDAWINTVWHVHVCMYVSVWVFVCMCLIMYLFVCIHISLCVSVCVCVLPLLLLYFMLSSWGFKHIIYK